jgi:hypothetical protein
VSSAQVCSSANRSFVMKVYKTLFHIFACHDLHSILGINHALSLKRSLFLEELVSVSKLEKRLKKYVECIVFLKIGKKLDCYRFVTVFCYKNTLKTVVSHLARTNSSNSLRKRVIGFSVEESQVTIFPILIK